jgi:hypothetical protein
MLKNGPQFDTFAVNILSLRDKYSILFFLFLLIPVLVSGQADSLEQKKDSIPERVYLLQKVNRNGETLPEAEIKEVSVVAHSKSGARKAQSEYRKYERLIFNLKLVYPYALIVRSRLAQVNDELAGLKSDKDRRKYVKNVEKEVLNEYEDEISEMTITQGRLLIKLIDRETQNTSYDLIRQYRGGLTAAFWQGIARIFGTNLKEEYDPYGEDAMIEYILRDIEAGAL